MKISPSKRIILTILCIMASAVAAVWFVVNRAERQMLQQPQARSVSSQGKTGATALTAGTNPTPVIPGVSFSKTFWDKGAEESKPRLALVNMADDKALMPYVDLLFANLSSSRAISLVERADLKKVFSELAISGAGMVEPGRAVKLGTLLRAHGLVFMQLNDEKTSLRTRIVETQRGVRFADWEVQWSGSNLNVLADNAASVVVKSASKLGLPPGDRVLLGIKRIGNATLSPHLNWIDQALPQLLSVSFVSNDRVFVLERTLLGEIEQEALTTGHELPDYLRSVLVVEGEVELAGRHAYKLGLRVHAPGQDPVRRLQTVFAPDNPELAVDDIAGQLLQALPEVLSDNRNSVETEASEYARLSRVSALASSDAIAAAEAAMALGVDLKKAPEMTKTLIRNLIRSGRCDKALDIVERADSSEVFADLPDALTRGGGSLSEYSIKSTVPENAELAKRIIKSLLKSVEAIDNMTEWNSGFGAANGKRPPAYVNRCITSLGLFPDLYFERPADWVAFLEPAILRICDDGRFTEHDRILFLSDKYLRDVELSCGSPRCMGWKWDISDTRKAWQPLLLKLTKHRLPHVRLIAFRWLAMATADDQERSLAYTRQALKILAESVRTGQEWSRSFLRGAGYYASIPEDLIAMLPSDEEKTYWKTQVVHDAIAADAFSPEAFEKELSRMKELAPAERENTAADLVSRIDKLIVYELSQQSFEHTNEYLTRLQETRNKLLKEAPELAVRFNWELGSSVLLLDKRTEQGDGLPVCMLRDGTSLWTGLVGETRKRTNTVVQCAIFKVDLESCRSAIAGKMQFESTNVNVFAGQPILVRLCDYVCMAIPGRGLIVFPTDGAGRCSVVTEQDWLPSTQITTMAGLSNRLFLAVGRKGGDDRSGYGLIGWDFDSSSLQTYCNSGRPKNEENALDGPDAPQIHRLDTISGQHAIRIVTSMSQKKWENTKAWILDGESSAIVPSAESIYMGPCIYPDADGPFPPEPQGQFLCPLGFDGRHFWITRVWDFLYHELRGPGILYSMDPGNGALRLVVDRESPADVRLDCVPPVLPTPYGTVVALQDRLDPRHTGLFLIKSGVSGGGADPAASPQPADLGSATWEAATSSRQAASASPSKSAPENKNAEATKKDRAEAIFETPR